MHKEPFHYFYPRVELTQSLGKLFNHNQHNNYDE